MASGFWSTGALEHWSLLGTRHCWGLEGARPTAIPVAANGAVQVTCLAAVAAAFFSLWLAATHMAGWCGGSCGSDRQDSVRV